MMQAPLVTGTDFVTVAATTDLGEGAAILRGGPRAPGVHALAAPGREALGGELETGTLTLALVDSAALGIEFRPNNHPIALHVDDFEAARATLESRGVRFTSDTVDSGVCRQIYFRDPDGNAIGIHHRYAPPGR